MADEAVLLVETDVPVNFTSSTAIEKGAVCKMTSAMTAATSDGDTDVCAGIAQSEVTTNDESVAIYQGGIFRCVAGVAGVTVGSAVITDSSTSSANRLVNADVNSENIVGTALSTATSGNTFVLHLNPRGLNLA